MLGEILANLSEKVGFQYLKDFSRNFQMEQRFSKTESNQSGYTKHSQHMFGAKFKNNANFVDISRNVKYKILIHICNIKMFSCFGY